MKLSAVERAGKIVPDWNGNLELPKVDQVSIEFHWPVFSEKEKLEVGSIDLLNPTPEDSRRIAGLATRYVETCVDKVLNLHVGEEKILTGKDIVNSPHDFTALVFIIFWHIWMGTHLLAQKKTPLSDVIGSSPRESRRRRRRHNRMPS